MFFKLRWNAFWNRKQFLNVVMFCVGMLLTCCCFFRWILRRFSIFIDISDNRHGDNSLQICTFLFSFHVLCFILLWLKTLQFEYEKTLMFIHCVWLCIFGWIHSRRLKFRWWALFRPRKFHQTGDRTWAFSDLAKKKAAYLRSQQQDFGNRKWIRPAAPRAVFTCLTKSSIPD